MTEFVVDPLEVIDIDERHDEGLVRPPGPGDLLLKQGNASVPQVHTGEAIERGERSVLRRGSAIGQRGVTIQFSTQPFLVGGHTISDGALAIKFGTSPFADTGRAVRQRRGPVDPRMSPGADSRATIIRRPRPVRCRKLPSRQQADENVPQRTLIQRQLRQRSCLVALRRGLVPPASDLVPTVGCHVAKLSRPVPFITSLVSEIRGTVPLCRRLVAYVASSIAQRRHVITTVTGDIALIGARITLVARNAALEGDRQVRERLFRPLPVPFSHRATRGLTKAPRGCGL